MWIHVPSAYVQDMEESNWDSVQLSQELEPSATWSGKSKPAKSWERVLKTESLTTLLSGLTLEPLMRQHGVDRYISSLEDSLANPILLQDYEKESQIPENSQEKYSVLQTNLGDQLSFLRMCQESKSSGSTTSDPSFKEWDTELRKSSLLRQKQAHHIRGSDYSSWHTLLEDDSSNVSPSDKRRDSLAKQTNRWPTLTVAEAGKIGNRPNYGQQGLSNHPAIVGYPEREKMDKSRKGDANLTDPDQWMTPKQRDHKGKGFKTDLTTQSQSWPSPAARDTGGFDGPGKQKPSRPREVYVSILPDQVIHEDGSMCSPKCRRLSPLFAEWLMGLPQGYLDSSEPVEMELFQQWQQELGSYLSGNLITSNSEWPTLRAANPGSRKPGTGGKVLNEEAKNWSFPKEEDIN